MDKIDYSNGKIAIKNTNSNYSVHTFEVAMEFDTYYELEMKRILGLNFTENKQRRKVKNKRFYEWSESKEKGCCNRYTCYDNEKLFERGILDVRIVEVMCKEHGAVPFVWKCYLRFRVNPRPLLEHFDNRYICIAPEEELSLVIPKIKDILPDYGMNAYMLDNLYIRRLDYCCNIDLGSQESAERFLKLLKKGGYYMAMNFKPKMFDARQHRYVYPKNEVRYINNAGCTHKREELSIYLKYSQMNESEKDYNKGELEMAKGQIRIELRTERPKLRYLKKRYQCSGSDDLLGISGEIGENLLNNYLHGLYGSGKFVNTSEAIKRINASAHRPTVKRHMVNIVMATKRFDFAEACNHLSTSGKYEIRKYFNDLGISPITLSDSWEEKEFENPVTYIMTNNVNER